MCTVLLRFAPGTRWPLLVGAVRDEFLDRPWQPPAPHWSTMPAHASRPANLPDSPAIGGMDEVAGGTWLAVDPSVPALAALLNGPPLPPLPPVPLPPGHRRRSRGWLPLMALAGATPRSTADVAGYEGFHLLHADRSAATVYTWNGDTYWSQPLAAGDHIIVNAGVDAIEDPLVPHFAPLLAATPTPDPSTGDWGAWPALLAGHGLDPGDPRALIVRKDFGGLAYGSGSASLVALGADGTVRYDFTANPGPAADWYRVPV